MKRIYFASFYFRVWDLTREIRENKNPAKISTYTVFLIFHTSCIEMNQQFQGPFGPLVLTFCGPSPNFEGNWPEARLILTRFLDSAYLTALFSRTQTMHFIFL